MLLTCGNTICHPGGGELLAECRRGTRVEPQWRRAGRQARRLVGKLMADLRALFGDGEYTRLSSGAIIDRLSELPESPGGACAASRSTVYRRPVVPPWVRSMHLPQQHVSRRCRACSPIQEGP
jgi:hypothetical protein